MSVYFIQRRFIHLDGGSNTRTTPCLPHHFRNRFDTLPDFTLTNNYCLFGHCRFNFSNEKTGG